MAATIDLNFKPRLRHCTLYEDPASGAIRVVVGKDSFELSRISGDRNIFLKIKSFFDGRYTIRDISLNTGASLESITQIITTFNEHGLLQDRVNHKHITVNTFIDRVESSTLMWRRQIGLHRLFSGLYEGRFRGEVFIGLLIETYHYIRLLSPTLSDISLSIRCPFIRDVVRDYALGEKDHFRLYLPALSKIERIGAHFLSAHPTVGTLSLLRNFESIGRRSGLSLVCCLQLIEARSDEVVSAEENFRKIARKFDLEDVIEPFIAHMIADVELGHSGILRSALQSVGDISIDDAHDAVNDMHDVKHCFDAFHDSIILYYSDISNYIPRPKVDYFAM